MVDLQLAWRGISDPRVLDAFRPVPRESFVPEELAASAYRDAALPIGEEQTISQPYIVALMTEALRLAGRRTRAGDRHGLGLRRRGAEPDGEAGLHGRTSRALATRRASA